MEGQCTRGYCNHLEEQRQLCQCEEREEEGG